MSAISKFKNLTKTLRKSATNTVDRKLVEKEVEAARAAIKAQAEAEEAARIAALREAEIREKKLQSRIRKQSLESTRERSGFENWASGGPTTAETLADINTRRAREIELGKKEGVKDINIRLYNALEKLPISGSQRVELYKRYKNDPDETRFMSEVLGIQHGEKSRILKKDSDPAKLDLKSTGSRQLKESSLGAKDSSPKISEAVGDDFSSRKTSGARELDESTFEGKEGPHQSEIGQQLNDPFSLYKRPSGTREMSEEAVLRSLFKEEDKSDIGRKAAVISALTGGGLAASSLMPEEAEAGVRGSAAARRKILEKTEKIMDAWTSGKKDASGGRGMRELLQNQLDLDPTGTAKKEALRRLAARTEVRKNPVTGEHEFKVYRGGVKDRFSESPQSFTTNPDVADAFAQEYGGEVKEVWLPASSVGSIPNIMKEGQFLSSENEVIAKPFKAESRRYTPKEPSIHEKINKRAESSSTKPEPDAEYEGWPDDFDEYIEEPPSRKTKKVAGLAAGGIGAGGMAASNSTYASDAPTISQSSSELNSSTTSKAVKDAAFEEQEKSKLLNTLESYGTGARSAISSATLGISEPVVSGLNAAVGSLIEAGFDAKDAVEFIKKASEIERFKKNYEEDVAYRKKMQEEHPVADISGSLVGAFSPVGPAASVTKLTEKAARSIIPAIKAAQEAKGLKAAATRIGGNVLEGAISTPIITGAETATKRLFGNEEEYSPFEDAFVGGAFGGVLSGAMEAGKAIGGKKVAGTLGALGLAAGLSGDRAQAKEQPVLDLTEDQKNELRWRSIMRQINKKSSEM